MIHFTLIVIVVNVPGAAAPIVQEQPIVQVDKQPPEPGLINWHCPQCNWFNAYDNQKSFKNGTKQHLKKCKGAKKLFG